MSDASSFDIRFLELGPMENLVYLITDKKSKRAAVVDPAWQVSEIIKLAQEKDVQITDVLLTHSHFDHINGIDEVLKDYDAQVHLLKAEAKFWGHYQDASTAHHGGDIIKLGETEIEILHTPGHTPGSACYHVGEQLITGDTLFVFGCGRCDLDGGDPNVMYDTLRKLEKDMPSQTVICPGHHYAEHELSTMAEQVEGNPFMHFHKREDFVQYRMHDHDKTRSSPYHAVLRKNQI
ncbi:MAG: MBL fold metallo-hydrolase [Gammaproteobacteria bacterium]|nr:MBL fold metallo-hydrolase [Gammaproteobacteria bacterium]